MGAKITFLEKLALKTLGKRFPWIDVKKFKGADEVEAITFSVTEEYINKVGKL